MQVYLESKTIFTLTLESDEAEWLNQVMQNPLHGQSYATEDPRDAHMRAKFFNATKHP
jgi:hypothetical protein